MVARLLERAGIAYWVFGGWGVDLHVGAVTRAHDDVDIAVWLDDVPRIVALLVARGWRHAPYEDENGGTGYERDGVRLELTFLVRDGDDVSTPLRDAQATWPRGAFGDDVRELHGVRASVVAVEALVSGKSGLRADDATDAAKDRADVERLRQLS